MNKEIKIDDVENLGKICAQEILNNGGHELMKEIKAEIG
jgi:hydroxymethylbilane synthase